MVKNPYFQFPLRALSFGQTIDERLKTIISYSFIAAGSKLFRKLTSEERQAFIRETTSSRTNSPCIDPHDLTQCGASYGAKMIGVVIRDLKGAVERYNALRKFVAAFEARNGKDAQVRLKTDWLFKARDGQGITYREFAVLCGIYSAIGDKKLAIVTQARIRRCALGYRSDVIMQAELPHRADKAQPLTERQLRDTIARLHRNKFFARCTVGRRITYYSIRLDGDALRKKILERRTYPDFFRASQAALDQSLTAEIKKKRQEASGAEPKPITNTATASDTQPQLYR
jgi:hypothetical protein